MPLRYVWLKSQLQNNTNSLHSLYFSLRTPLLAPCSSAGKLQSLWKCLGVRGLLLLTRANDKKKRICADLLTYFFSTEPSCFTAAPWWQFKLIQFVRAHYLGTRYSCLIILIFYDGNNKKKIIFLFTEPSCFTVPWLQSKPRQLKSRNLGH